MERPSKERPRSESREESRDHGRAVRGRRWWVRPFFQGFLITLVVLVVACGVGAFLLARHYDSNIKRVGNVFAQEGDGSKPPPRPPVLAKDAENFLLVGSDVRAKGQTTGSGSDANVPTATGQRSDTIMVVHLPQGRKAAWVVSIPRDSWVAIPGHGHAKINAAFAYGGAALLRQTVEQLTGIHIDHYMEIDFNGFQRMTDALGGVDIDVPINSYDSANKVHWHAGWQHLNGKQALFYVRQRHGLPNGDLDRVVHQHQYLAAMMKKATSQGVLTNPIALNNFLNAFTSSVTVDSTLTGGDLRNLALSLVGLHMSDVHFMTAPYSGFGWEDGQSVVVLNQQKDDQLWQAIIHDRMSGYGAKPSPSPSQSTATGTG